MNEDILKSKDEELNIKAKSPWSMPTTGSQLSTIGSQPVDPQAIKTTQEPNRFVNLQRYLGANVDAPDIAKRATGEVKTQAQKVGEAIDQQKQQWTAGQLQPTQQILTSGQNWLTEAQQDPNKFVQRQVNETPEQYQKRISDWQNIRTGSIQAPTALDLSKQTEAAKIAQARATGLQTEEGRFKALQDYVKGPYSSGQSRLDELLMARQFGKPDTQTQLNQTTQNLAKMQPGIAAEEAKSAGQVKQLGELAGQEQSNIVNWLGKSETDPGAVHDVRTQLQKYYDSLGQDVTKDLPAALDALKTTGTQLDPSVLEHLKALGLDASSGMYLYGTDPSKYLTTNSLGAISEYMTPEQASRYAALTKLAGFSPTLDTTKAGTGKAPGQFDVEGFKNTLESNKTAFNKQISDPINRLMEWYNATGSQYPGAPTQDIIKSDPVKAAKMLTNLGNANFPKNAYYNAQLDQLKQLLNQYQQSYLGVPPSAKQTTPVPPGMII